jgi:hypothetical protein
MEMIMARGCHKLGGTPTKRCPNLTQHRHLLSPG